jgi:hypothetical protein
MFYPMSNVVWDSNLRYRVDASFGLKCHVVRSWVDGSSRHQICSGNCFLMCSTNLYYRKVTQKQYLLGMHIRLPHYIE